MATQQRLVVCLDGTWNRQDSSTNVLHHFNLVKEGPGDDTGIAQRKYYHLGVGTGVLDSLTGGGFGFGLEENVRDAYNWLVEHSTRYGGEKSGSGVMASLLVKPWWTTMVMLWLHSGYTETLAARIAAIDRMQ